jgi:Family of unknown function (DUF6527)
MNAVPHLRLRARVTSRSDASAYLKLPGDAVLVERGRPRLILLSCPCGCGEEFPINLDPRSGPAWRFYGGDRTGISVFPSVWRTSGCRSHYVIWRDRILLFGANEDYFDSASDADAQVATVDAIWKLLPDSGLVSFVDIANALDAVPWDIQAVCRRLVREGSAREGKGKERGRFGRRQ